MLNTGRNGDRLNKYSLPSPLRVDGGRDPTTYKAIDINKHDDGLVVGTVHSEMTRPLREAELDKDTLLLITQDLVTLRLIEHFFSDVIQHHFIVDWCDSLETGFYPEPADVIFAGEGVPTENLHCPIRCTKRRLSCGKFRHVGEFSNFIARG